MSAVMGGAFQPLVLNPRKRAADNATRTFTKS